MSGRDAGHRGVPRGAGSARASGGCAGAGRPEARGIRRSALGLHRRAEPVESVRRAERGAVRQPAAQVVPRELPVVHAHARMAGAAAAARRDRRRAEAEAEPGARRATPTCIRRFSPASSATSARSTSGASTTARAARASSSRRERRSRRKPPKWIVAGEPDRNDAAVRAHGRGSRAAVDRGRRRASHQAQLQRAALGRGARLRRGVRIVVAVWADAVVAPAGQLRQRRAARSAARSSFAKRWSKDARGCARHSSITIGDCGAKWSSWKRRCAAATCSSTSRRSRDFYLQRLPPTRALDRGAGEVAARAASEPERCRCRGAI